MIYKRNTIQSVKGYSFIFILYVRERERERERKKNHGSVVRALTLDCCVVPWWTVDLKGRRRSTGEWRPGQWLVFELRASSGRSRRRSQWLEGGLGGWSFKPLPPFMVEGDFWIWNLGLGISFLQFW